MKRAWKTVLAGWCIVLGAGLGGCGGGAGDGEGVHAAGPAAARSDVKQAQAFRSATGFGGNGWYWNPAEPGTGFMFEAQGDAAFVGFFMYEAGTGKAVWYAAYGEFFADDTGNHHFVGDLRHYVNGQSISAATVPPNGSSSSLGAVSIRFPAAGGASVRLPGGRAISATRFDFNGLGGRVRASQPETGWYWNPAEGGRGYAIEVQNNQLFMAMFHYNEDGSPTWNVVRGGYVSSGVLTAPFITYEGGQSLTSVFVPGGTDHPRGPFTLVFGDPCAGQVQRAGAPATSIRRFAIPGSTLAPGAECRALQTLADVPPAARPPDVTAAWTAAELAGVPALARLQAGDTVFGQIDDAGDADRYAVWLTAGVPYRFSVKGASSGSGSLPNPSLILHGPQGTYLDARDDISDSNRDALLAHTPASTGLHLLTVLPSSGGPSGTFVLAIDGGVAAELDASPVKPLASLAGTFNGLLRGSDGGSFTLTVGADGAVGGHVTLASAAGAPLSAGGSLQAGGVFRLTAGALSATGYVGPQGDLTGTWSSAGAAGGVFIGDRSNRLPVADAGPPRTVAVGSVVALDGRGSTDPDSTLAYRWEIVEQPPGDATVVFTPEMAAAPQPRFLAQAAGVYVARLTVSDELSVSRSEVTITVLPPEGALPVAQAPRHSVFTGIGSSARVPVWGAARGPVTAVWRLQGVPPGSAVPFSWSQSTEVLVQTDVAGAYDLVFELYDDPTNPQRVGSAPAQVVAADLAGRWAGPLGVAGFSSASIHFATLSSGALVGRLSADFHACGRHQRQEAEFTVPVRLFDASGNVGSFVFGSGALATLRAELSSGTQMSGTLSLTLAVGQACGGQALVLPWSAVRYGTL